MRDCAGRNTGGADVGGRDIAKSKYKPGLGSTQSGKSRSSETHVWIKGCSELISSPFAPEKIPNWELTGSITIATCHGSAK